MQVAELKVPAPLLLKLTVPVGVTGVAEVSVTVTVQVIAAPTATRLGLQLTEVDVICLVEGNRTTVMVPELPKWVESPP